MEKKPAGGLEPAKPHLNLNVNFEGVSSDAKLQYLKEYVKKLFNKYDSFDKGFLDKEDFTKLLEENTGNKFTDKEVEDLITAIDFKKNRLVEEEELYKLYRDLLTGDSKLGKWSDLITLFMNHKSIILL